MFQDDIYPPAYAGVPSMSADEWLGGMNKDPVTVSFTQDGLVLNKAPEAKKDAPRKELAKKKSPAVEPENMTPMQAKVHAFEKRSSSTELHSSRGTRSNSASVSPPPVSPTTFSSSSMGEPQTDAEVCVCVCVCVCTRTCKRAHVVCLSVHLSVCVYLGVHVCDCVYMCMYFWAYILNSWVMYDIVIVCDLSPLVENFLQKFQV